MREPAIRADRVRCHTDTLQAAYPETVQRTDMTARGATRLITATGIPNIHFGAVNIPLTDFSIRADAIGPMMPPHALH